MREVEEEEYHNKHAGYEKEKRENKEGGEI
jgi:hypothetical protein